MQLETPTQKKRCVVSYTSLQTAAACSAIPSNRKCCLAFPMQATTSMTRSMRWRRSWSMWKACLLKVRIQCVLRWCALAMDVTASGVSVPQHCVSLIHQPLQFRDPSNSILNHSKFACLRVCSGDVGSICKSQDGAEEATGEMLDVFAHRNC